MRGFKGFKKGLVCRGKQYSENTIFEEEKAEICASGMHFCRNPLEVWKFYPPCNTKGELNEFAEVESLDKVETDDNKKFCTSKLKVNKKLAFIDFVNEGIAITCEDADNDTKTNENDYSTVINSGDYSTAINSGDYSMATSSNDYSVTINTGKYSVATNTGWNAVSISESSYSSIAASTGQRSATTNKSEYSIAANTGSHAATASSGAHSITANTGTESAAIGTGYCSIVASTGSGSIAKSSGDCSIAASTGYNSTATVEGNNSIAITAGVNSRAKGVKGSWIVCVEYDECYNILCVKAGRVDGENIQENTFYTLKNGEFVKAE
jgi:hypothetical protein